MVGLQRLELWINLKLIESRVRCGLFVETV